MVGAGAFGRQGRFEPGSSLGVASSASNGRLLGDFLPLDGRAEELAAAATAAAAAVVVVAQVERRTGGAGRPFVVGALVLREPRVMLAKLRRKHTQYTLLFLLLKDGRRYTKRK